MTRFLTGLKNEALEAIPPCVFFFLIFHLLSIHNRCPDKPLSWASSLQLEER